MEMECPWMYQTCNWQYYGPLLYKAKSYSEFALKCIIMGYVNPDAKRRNDKTLPFYCRHEPYEEFIYSEACTYRGNGSMNRKAKKFRDEMIKLEIMNGERNEDGTLRS